MAFGEPDHGTPERLPYPYTLAVITASSAVLWHGLLALAPLLLRH